MRVYLRDGSAQTILRAATLRQKLQIKLSISPSHSILTPGRPVPALTLWRQAPGRVATGVPMFKSLVWLGPEKIPAQAGFEPGTFRSRGGRLNHLANEAMWTKLSILVLKKKKKKTDWMTVHHFKNTKKKKKKKKKKGLSHECGQTSRVKIKKEIKTL